MQPSRAVRDAMVNLLAADTATFASVAANKVTLIIEPFVPGLDVVLADLVPATFTGGAPKNAGIGTAQVFLDPATGNKCLQLLEPAGGWTWICTADPAAPETVVGWICTNAAGTVVLGMGLLATPVTISATGQAVLIDRINCQFLPNSPQ